MAKWFIQIIVKIMILISYYIEFWKDVKVFLTE